MEYLPNEVVYDILLRASCDSLFKWRLICSEFRNIIDDDMFWRHKCSLFFPKLKLNKNYQTYKHLYLSSVIRTEAFYGCEMYTSNFTYLSLENSLRQRDYNLFKYLLHKIPSETKFGNKYWRVMYIVGTTCNKDLIDTCLNYVELNEPHDPVMCIQHLCAGIAKSGNLDMFKYMFDILYSSNNQYYLKDFNYHSIVTTASKYSSYSILNYILEDKMPLFSRYKEKRRYRIDKSNAANIPIYTLTQYVEDMLVGCCQSNNENYMKDLMNKYSDHISLSHLTIRSLLSKSCRSGSIQCLEYLLSYADKIGCTYDLDDLYMSACNRGLIDVMMYLINTGKIKTSTYNEALKRTLCVKSVKFLLRNRYANNIYECALHIIDTINNKDILLPIIFYEKMAILCQYLSDKSEIRSIITISKQCKSSAIAGAVPKALNRKLM